MGNNDSEVKGKDTTNRAKTRKVAMRKPAKCRLFVTFRPATPKYATFHALRFLYCLSYLCLARRKVAMRKPVKITIWRIFALRPFAFSPRKHVYSLTLYNMARISHHNLELFRQFSTKYAKGRYAEKRHTRFKVK